MDALFCRDTLASEEHPVVLARLAGVTLAALPAVGIGFAAVCAYTSVFCGNLQLGQLWFKRFKDILNCHLLKLCRLALVASQRAEWD